MQHHLRSKFATESCQQALADFEYLYPVSFALDLIPLHEEKPKELLAAPEGSSVAGRGRPNAGSQTRRGSLPQNAIPQPPIAVRLGMRSNSPMSSSTRSVSSSGGGSKIVYVTDFYTGPISLTQSNLSYRPIQIYHCMRCS